MTYEPNDETPTNMVAAVATRDQIIALNALADRLATELDAGDLPKHVVAPISRQLAQVLATVSDLEAATQTQTLAEALAEARVSRLSREAANSTVRMAAGE
ncbi:hypothetical protein [Ilumatobacter sp.]|uniref:hypothetical protein n=1 Tax=Ilumatobacter sp. TaxID=1967498 RepID=UPI0037523F08